MPTPVLEPADLASLQLVSRTFRTLARDNSLWRLRCFEDSTFLRILNHRRSLGIEPAPAPNGPVEYNHAVDLTRQRARSAPSPGRLGTPTKGGSVAAGDRERARIMANWDPCFPSEPVCWYDEYIQRHGPVVVNWMQLPRAANLSKGDFVEARGVALYRPDNPHQESSRWETLLAVSPLNDGSVCLWDVNGTRTGKKGSIVARSRPGILFIDGPDADNKRRSKRIDSGVTESVSVDSVHHRAFFAVQGRKCIFSAVFGHGTETYIRKRIVADPRRMQILLRWTCGRSRSLIANHFLGPLQPYLRLAQLSR